MKHIATLLIFISFQMTMQAQIKLPQERIVVIANLVNNSARTIDYSLDDLSIESKIIRILKLDVPKVELKNPVITKEEGMRWFLIYEFTTPEYSGKYKEELQIRNGQLVITESRNAVMAMATNCKKLEFTNDLNRCKCVDKQIPSLDSQLTYRLFTSNR